MDLGEKKILALRSCVKECEDSGALAIASNVVAQVVYDIANQQIWSFWHKYVLCWHNYVIFWHKCDLLKYKYGMMFVHKCGIVVSQHFNVFYTNRA